MEGRPFPYTLGYLDLDGGPRVLVRIQQEQPARVPLGSRLRLVATPVESGADDCWAVRVW